MFIYSISSFVCKLESTCLSDVYFQTYSRSYLFSDKSIINNLFSVMYFTLYFIYILSGAHEPPKGRQGASNSALYIACNAFDIERLSHLPFMELFSSGEFPSVVTVHACFLFDVGYRCRHR